MKNLIIVGAGGMGREIYNLSKQCHGYSKEYIIKGFLDDNLNSLDEFIGYPPILNTIDEYEIGADDIFIWSLGNVENKKRAINCILNKGGEFITLIHPSAIINSGCKIGKGCVILQNAVVGDHAIVGDYVLLQISTIIGHDSQIGNYSRVDCLAVCVGGVIVEDEVTIHTSAVINHNVRIEAGATIGSSSFVIRSVKKNATVHGNPAVNLK